MNKRVFWLTLSSFVASFLLLTSCASEAPPATEKPAQPAAEKPAPKQEQPAPKPGAEMVRIKATKSDGTVVEKLVEKPRYGGVLNQCSSTAPLSFDNVLRHVSLCETLHLTNETLLKGDWSKGPEGTGEAGWLYNMMPSRDTIAGSLAESWEFKDANTIVFHIRKGVKWHNKPPTNGREMTAEDCSPLSNT